VPHDVAADGGGAGGSIRPTSRRHEVEREFIANALYLGIVLYVTLAVIPPTTCPAIDDLVLLIIGTGAGLSSRTGSRSMSQPRHCRPRRTRTTARPRRPRAQVRGRRHRRADGCRAVCVRRRRDRRPRHPVPLGVLPALAGYAIGRRRGYSVLASALVALASSRFATLDHHLQGQRGALRHSVAGDDRVAPVTKVGVIGAAGKMGNLACTTIEQADGLDLVARVDEGRRAVRPHRRGCRGGR
jgi:hypothetical protein